MSIPDDSIPEHVARKLQPYVERVQLHGFKHGEQYGVFRISTTSYIHGALIADKFHVLPKLGVDSFYLDVPPTLGCCNIVKPKFTQRGSGSVEVITICGGTFKPLDHPVVQVASALSYSPR